MGSTFEVKNTGEMLLKSFTSDPVELVKLFSEIIIGWDLKSGEDQLPFNEDNLGKYMLHLLRLRVKYSYSKPAAGKELPIITLDENGEPAITGKKPALTEEEMQKKGTLLLMELFTYCLDLENFVKN